MSVARKVLREKESKGEVIPYIRESGFVVYTTPAEVEKRKGGVPIMISDALEEVASSVNSEPVITEEMDLALAAAGAPGSVKPSKLARKRREAGEKKESRKDTRPEVIVEPLEGVAMRHPETTIETPKAAPLKEPVSKEVASEKEAKPKKAAEKKEAKPKKAAEKKEAKPKKAAEKKEAKPKKAAEKKEAKPKKAAEKKEAKPKKAAEKKEAKPKKAAEKKEAKPKKAAEKKEAKPKKAASNKKSE
jgi:hypothetical protein